MKINRNCVKNICHGLASAFQKLNNQIANKIQEIKNRILLAYHEPSKTVPKLVLPPHPMPNTYPKQYKKIKWPKYLDNAHGASYAHPEDLYGIALKCEPLELVTPLHAVTLGDNEKGFYRLIADGGSVAAKDIRGQTPAYWAAYHGNINMLMKLKIFGAQLEQKDYRGKVPLRAAAKYGHDKVITFLASQGVSLNVLDGRGLTPLHVAAYHGRFSTYSTLIYCGADQAIKDPLGRTAEDILKMKYAEMYHKKCFLGRLFSSPLPPKLPLSKWKIDTLKSKSISN